MPNSWDFLPSLGNRCQLIQTYQLIWGDNTASRDRAQERCVHSPLQAALNIDMAVLLLYLVHGHSVSTDALFCPGSCVPAARPGLIP